MWQVDTLSPKQGADLPSDRNYETFQLTLVMTRWALVSRHCGGVLTGNINQVSFYSSALVQ